MEAKRIATQLLKSVESMVDPKAPVEQQLAQLKAQMAALAELPNLINQKLESVNKQISQISVKESVKSEDSQEQRQVEVQKRQEVQNTQQYYQQHHQQKFQQQNQNRSINQKHSMETKGIEPYSGNLGGIQIRVTKPSLTGEELDVVKREELRRSLEDLRMRKSVSPSKDQMLQGNQNDQRSVRTKPTPAFGPVTQERPLYLPGGRRWKLSMSDYDEDQISETLVGQAEVIKGNAMGVNFKKFEKPPVGLEHLKHSEVYRAVHNLDDEPLGKVAMLPARPAMAASEIRERLRSMSPASPAMDAT